LHFLNLYWNTHKLKNRISNNVGLTFFNNIFEYERKFYLKYVLLFNLIEKFPIQTKKVQDMKKKLNKLIKISKNVSKGFDCYTSNFCIFQSYNIQFEIEKLTQEENAMFYSDVQIINWAKYLTSYFYGITTLLLKEKVMEPYNINILYTNKQVDFKSDFLNNDEYHDVNFHSILEIEKKIKRNLKDYNYEEKVLDKKINKIISNVSSEKVQNLVLESGFHTFLKYFKKTVLVNDDYLLGLKKDIKNKSIIFYTNDSTNSWFEYLLVSFILNKYNITLPISLLSNKFNIYPISKILKYLGNLIFNKRWIFY
jgi:hypothetical protein